MIVYRVLHRLVSDLLTGSGNDGRWCSHKRKVIYTSSSVALACLENILRRSGAGFSTDFRTITYKIAGNLKMEEIKLKDLPENWRSAESYPACQAIGNKWYDNNESAVLKVPSAIIPGEFNFVIKTSLPLAKRIQVIANNPFVPDERLEKMLKSIKKN